MIKNKLNFPDLLSTSFLVLLFSALVVFNLIFGFNQAFYIVSALSAVVISFLRPRCGLWAVIFLTLVFAKHFTLSSFIINQEEYKFYLIDIFLVAIYFRVALDWLKSQKLNFNKLDWLFLAFIIWTILSFWYSVAVADANFAVAFSSLKNYTFYPLLYFVVWRLLPDKASWRQLLTVFIAGASVSIAYLAYGLVSGQGLWTEITPLTTSGVRYLDFDHAFYLALASVVIVPIIILQSKRHFNYLTWLLPLMLLGVIGSLMRHLWLAGFVYAVALLFLLGPDRQLLKHWLARYLAVGLIGISILLFVVNVVPMLNTNSQLGEGVTFVSERVLSFTDSSDTSFSWRSSLWYAVWLQFIETPIFGSGLGQRTFLDMGAYKDFIELRNVHNSFLSILIQLGLLGLGLLITFVIGTAYQVWFKVGHNANQKLIKIIIIGLLIFCTSAFMFQPYLEANWFSVWWWLTLGLAKSFYCRG